MICIDFETQAIQPRPQFPPRPVGVAIARTGRSPRYYAWGHPSENNSTFEEARAALGEALDSGQPLLFHNAPFDLAVLHERMELPLPSWDRVHDTMLSAFLNNPYDRLALKPLAEKHLGMPPEERDAVKDWLVEHRVCRPNAADWGAFIAYAPGDLVGTYAVGDVERTVGLHKHFLPSIVGRGMQVAYDRERQLQAVLYANEQQGVRVDLDLLESDITAYDLAMTKTEDWLRRRLKADNLNFDSNEELADALEPVVTRFDLTATGKRSVAKGSLTIDKFKDRQVFLALAYRNRLQTCLSTFMRPWCATARASGGRIFTNWRQNGAVTGRMSSSPNFQNMPKSWTDKPDGYEHPRFLRVPELPLLRKYILPDEGHVLVGADYSGQELRVAAHFEDGELLEKFNADPQFDLHAFVQRTIEEMTGRHYERRICKIGMFSTLYGAGANAISEQLALSYDEAAELKRLILAAVPGIRDLDCHLKDLARQGKSFRTLGGREYYAEEPSIIDGRLQTWDYKMLNYLIQGSSADMTKAAMIRYDSCKEHGRLLLSVHDELVLSVPKEKALDESRLLVESMSRALPIDAPMIAEAKFGPNFAELK